MSTSVPPRRRFTAAVAHAATALTLAGLGCAAWPFGAKPDRTSIITPAMRSAAIREMGPRARNAGPVEQQQMCQRLAQQIQTEPDPLVRKAIQQTIAEFDDPLAAAVLKAGLNDEHREVRLACCRKLAERRQGDAVGPLREIVAADPDADVRLAAVAALGKIGTPEAIGAITLALDDRDPALQYAGVEAMRAVSDENLGNDVSAWRQYAATLAPQDDAPTAVAGKPGDAAAY